MDKKQAVQELADIVTIYRNEKRCPTLTENQAEALGFILDNLKPFATWIVEPSGEGFGGLTINRYRCSSCGWYHSTVIPDSYCPNCGSRMKERERL